MQSYPELYAVAAFIAILILYLLYQYVSRHSSFYLNKNKLLERFQTLRARSNKMQELVNQYILSNSELEDMLTDNFTHEDFLKYLQKNHIQNLSEKNYVRVKRTKNWLLLQKASNMLDLQEQKLDEAEYKIKEFLEEV